MELAQIDTLVQRVLAPGSAASPSFEEVLLEEYHDLADRELEDKLTEAQAARFREVVNQLNALDEQDPMEQAMDARLRETGAELDAILERVKNAPRKVASR